MNSGMRHESSRTGRGKHPASSSHERRVTASPSSSGSATNHHEQDVQKPLKRARGIGYVTPNACTECREKRAKCDGQNPCARCKSQGVTQCTYKKPVRQSKEALRSEIEALKSHQDRSDHVFAALVGLDMWTDVVSRLRNGGSVDSISKWLSGALSCGVGVGVDALPVAFNGDISETSSIFRNNASASYASGSRNFTPAGGSPIAIIPRSSRPRRTLSHDGGPGSTSDGPFSSTRSQVNFTNAHSDLMDWTTDTPPQRQMVGSKLEDTGASENQTFRGPDEGFLSELPDSKVPASAWTKITDDSGLVRHLLALYFCWEYPAFAPLSKEQFVRDFQDGRARYCSSILINALLGLGCRFSTQQSMRINPDDSSTCGDHFFKECLRLLHQEEDQHNLTTIQALGIMSMREASFGRVSESRYYAGQSIRLAVEMGLHQIQGDGVDADETTVKSATFWGAFALELTWSLTTGTLPHYSFFPHLPPKPTLVQDVEASLWIPYADDGEWAPLGRPYDQPSNVWSVYKCFCELSELAHQSLYVLYSSGRPLTGQELVDINNQYINWYDKIPEVLRLGVNSTPPVIFAHMYYHFSNLLLFRPFINLRIIDSIVSPRDVCWQAADAIQALARSYSRLYTLKRTPSFVPYFVLASSIMHFTIGASLLPRSSPAPQSGSATEPGLGGQSSGQQQHSTTEIDPRIAEAINRGIENLREMAPYHPFAQEATNMLLRLAKKWKMEGAIKEEELDEARPDDKPSPTGASPLDRRGTWPVTDSLNFLAPDVEEGGQAPLQPTAVLEAMDQATQAWRREEEDEAVMSGAVDYPLVWPFPVQGRPMLPTGDKLREAGFELLLAGELT